MSPTFKVNLPFSHFPEAELKAMDDLMNKLFELIEPSNAIAIVTALFVLGLFKLDWFRYMEGRHDRKLRERESLVQLLEKPSISAEASGYIGEHLERSMFAACFGIDASPSMRNALFRLQQKASNEISWADLKRAMPHMRLERGHLSVHINGVDHAFRWLILIVHYSTLTAGIGAILLAFLVPDGRSLGQTIGLHVLGTLLLGLALLYQTINAVYDSKVRVRKAILSWQDGSSLAPSGEPHEERTLQVRHTGLRGSQSLELP